MTGLTFDDTLPSGATPDAFGASLLDPITQSPLEAPVNNSTDSYYIQDLVNGVAQGHAASGVTVTTSVGGSLRIALDVSALQGQQADLLFRLIGGSDVTQLKGSVGISDVTIGGVVASTTTTAADQTASFSTSDQQVPLSALVASGAGPVNEGTVTFSVMSGNTLVGAAVTSATVSAGVASASFKLPGNSPAGSYTIVAAYSGARLRCQQRQHPHPRCPARCRQYYRRHQPTLNAHHGRRPRFLFRHLHRRHLPGQQPIRGGRAFDTHGHGHWDTGL